MNSFIIFYAPFIVVIIGIIIAFWWAPKDHHATKNEGKSRE
ncbi:cytochrome bd oxidase small subunit CydS [Lysinibacillus sphaericus]